MTNRTKRTFKGEYTSHKNIVLHLTENLMQYTNLRPSSAPQAGTMGLLGQSGLSRESVQLSGAELQGLVMSELMVSAMLLLTLVLCFLF